MHNLLDDKSIYEFNSYVLGFLLNQNNLFCEPVEGSLGNEPLFSIELLAYVFFSQMVALLNTLDKKIANQCKANIVRILKRVNLNLSSVFKEQFLVS